VPLTQEVFQEGKPKSDDDAAGAGAGAVADADLRPGRYWCVAAAAFFVKEAGVDDVLAWVPFSTKLELLFFLWLQLPGLRGADVLFRWLTAALPHLIEAGAAGAKAKDDDAVGDSEKEERPAKEEDGSDDALDEKKGGLLRGRVKGGDGAAEDDDDNDNETDAVLIDAPADAKAEATSGLRRRRK